MELPSHHPFLSRYRIGFLLLLALGLLPFTCAAHSETTTTTLPVANGITLTQEITTGDLPLVINILKVDLKAHGVHLRCGQAQDAITLNGPSKGREPLHALANRNGAVAAVNADFFPFTGDPLGLAIRDGELMSEPTGYRACLGISPKGVLIDVLSPYGALDLADGTPLSLDGINRIPHDGEIVVLTPSYSAAPHLEKPGCVVTLQMVALPVKVSQDMQGAITAVTPIKGMDTLPPCPAGSVLLVACGSATDRLAQHCQVGDPAKFRFDLTPSGPAPARGKYASRASLVRGKFRPIWTDVEQAVGGGPWLVRNGEIAIDWESEGLDKTTFVNRRHPRTAIGVTADDKLLLVTVDGRSALSVGATLEEMAAIMKRLGAVNALNCDGGGSTTMVVGNGVVNAPSDGRERPIADSLLVYADPLPNTETNPAPAPPPSPLGIQIHAGESLPLQLADPTGSVPALSAGILWGTADGLGFVNQRGIFSGTHAGNGSVIAHIGSSTITVPVRILPAAPAIIKATLTPIPDYPPYYSLLRVTVTDSYGNPVEGVKLTADLEKGQLDAPLSTDSKGQASSQVIWDIEPAKRLAKLSTSTISPIIVRPKTAPSGKANVSEDPDDR